MSKIFHSHQIILFLLIGAGIIFPAQEEISREAFYKLLEDYCNQLHQIEEMYDSTLSNNTNVELQTRKWNDYLTQNLPQKFWVIIPVDKVTLKKSSFQRLAARIEFEFTIELPRENFQFENNIDSQNQFDIDIKSSERDQKSYLMMTPEVKNIIIEAPTASQYNIVEMKGNLLFEIKMNLFRGTNWLQFYDTILSINSVKWVAENNILWELNILPFDEIMQRKK